MPGFNIDAVNPSPLPCTISTNGVTMEDGEQFVIVTISTAAGICHAWIPLEDHMKVINEILRTAKEVKTGGLIVPGIDASQIIKDINNGQRN